MTFAWYGPLKSLAGSPWWIAALGVVGIALFEYLLQVPANRIGFTALSLAQLKIMGRSSRSACSCRSRCCTWASRSTLDYPWAGLMPSRRGVVFIFRS